MRRMSPGEARAFLAHGTRTAKLGRRIAEIDDWVIRLSPDRILARADIAL